MSYREIVVWERCREGESFFVPSCDPQHTYWLFMEEGRKKYGPKVWSRICVYRQGLGVMFIRQYLNVRPPCAAASPAP